FTSTITEGINQDSLNILVGNSSDPGNCHLEMFRALKEELAKKGLQNYNIVCPLSYGSDDHAEKVIKKGELLFGSNFMPLTNFLP
ncbi:MAG TPA: 4-alpha-L-fucosyltransferase, partial [Balneola sp.]|nr:4-alpha-L-fucosyltransferase [Balneola sp.]